MSDADAAAAAAAIPLPRERCTPPELCFTPSERPPWRPDGPDTSQLLRQVQIYTRAYVALPANSRAKQWMLRTFVPRAAVRYILSSNLMEHVGTQDLPSTEAVLLKSIQQPQQMAGLRPPPSAAAAVDNVYLPDLPAREVAAMTRAERQAHAERETSQTLVAMQFLQRHVETQMAEAKQAVAEGQVWATEAQRPVRELEGYLLDADLLPQVHLQLMDGLLSKSSLSLAGELRTTDVCAGSLFFDTHFYPPVENVKAELHALVDDYNDIVASMHAPDADNLDACVEECFKLAALLLYKFLSLHPFGNGNGRMSRLLANRALMPVLPFPVPAEPSTVPAAGFAHELRVQCQAQKVPMGKLTQHTISVRTRRDVYLLALELCRYGVGAECGQPRHLTALLIENAHALWLEAFEQLQLFAFVDHSLAPLLAVSIHVRIPPAPKPGKAVSWTDLLSTQFHQAVGSQLNPQQVTAAESELLTAVRSRIPALQDEADRLEQPVSKLISFTLLAGALRCDVTFTVKQHH